MIIVIDGPAGSGKSSTARAAAKKLGIEYIDSGALYRAVTLLFIEARNKKAFFDTLANVTVSFRYLNERFEVFIDETNVTAKLRNTAISEQVSSVAAIPRVRNFVNALMRETVKKGAYIAEGRDLGSAVFPDAAVKFFMKANLDKRAQRRFAELQEAGTDISLQEVRRNILLRDKKDSARVHDPLKKASDAIVIDTSEMKFEEQLDKICSIIQTKTNIKIKQKP